MQLSLAAEAWSARLLRDAPSSSWNETLVWPLGAMAGAALASAEAFKCGMRKLRRFARDKVLFEEFLGPITMARITLAGPESPMPDDLGTFDVISGGAITNGLFYALKPDSESPRSCEGHRAGHHSFPPILTVICCFLPIASAAVR